MIRITLTVQNDVAKTIGALLIDQAIEFKFEPVITSTRAVRREKRDIFANSTVIDLLSLAKNTEEVFTSKQIKERLPNTRPFSPYLTTLVRGGYMTRRGRGSYSFLQKGLDAAARMRENHGKSS
jgi:hypothetical protein